MGECFFSYRTNGRKMVVVVVVVYCGQTAGWIKMPLGMKVGLSPPDDSVLDGDPAYLPTKGVEPPPQFAAHFYCG